MARPLRVNFKNGWYHVTARGINRQRIYCDERDRRHGDLGRAMALYLARRSTRLTPPALGEAAGG